jgi:methylglutaconyl-CoA hydratase
MDENIKIILNKDIATLSFYHPKANSLPLSLLNDLKSTILDLYNQDVKVLVLKSANEKVFCSGASFDELLALKDIDGAISFFSAFAELMNVMVSAPFIIITQLNAKAIGGGVGLVAASDYVVASTQAAFKLSEFKVGIGPFAIAPYLRNKMGMANFSHVTFNPSLFFDVQCLEVRALINHIVSVDLDNQTMEKAQELLMYNFNALIEFKKLLWNNKEVLYTEALSNAKISASLVLEPIAQSFLNDFKSKK